MVLAASLLDEVASEYANHGCNDWEYPSDWSQQEKEEFCAEYHEWNGDPEEYNPKFLNLPDFAVMRFLAYKIQP